MAFKALKKLPAEIVAEVDQRLINGHPASEVAKWLQDELGHFTDLKTESVKKNLERYRAEDLKNKALQQLTDANKGKSAVTIKKQIDALAEMEELVNVQKGRFHKLLEKELGGPLLMKGVSDEARLLKEMLEKLGHLQLETGVLRRAPKKVSGTTFDPATGEVKQFTWTEEQEALYKELETIDLQAVAEPEQISAP